MSSDVGLADSVARLPAWKPAGWQPALQVSLAANIRFSDRDSIVPRRFHPRKEFFDSWKNHWLGLIGAGEFFHRIH